MKIAIIAQDEEELSQLQAAVPTTVVEDVFGFPFSAGNGAMDELDGFKPAAVLVSIPSESPDQALSAIEVVRSYLPEATLIAVGDISKPKLIVEAMRVGAVDFIGAPLDTAQLAKALANRSRAAGKRGRMFTFINAKGGSGATTIAVNIALALKSIAQDVILVDMAVPGNAALHLNCTPTYSMRDVAENLHRVDGTLLSSLIAKHESGLHLVAGADEPLQGVTGESLGKFADILVSAYEYVIVDASSALNESTRWMCDFSDQVFLVAQPDLASIWNAQRVRKYVGWESSPDKVKLVLNRYRPIAGVSESQYEKTSECKLAWTIPNQYVTVSQAITHGTPVARHANGELRNQFQAFARRLAGVPEPRHTAVQQKRSGWSLLERVSALKGLGSLGVKAADPA